MTLTRDTETVLSVKEIKATTYESKCAKGWAMALAFIFSEGFVGKEETDGWSEPSWLT